MEKWKGPHLNNHWPLDVVGWGDFEVSIWSADNDLCLVGDLGTEFYRKSGGLLLFRVSLILIWAPLNAWTKGWLLIEHLSSDKGF